MLQEFATLYGDIGLTGCIVACFLWLIYTMNTRASSQAESLQKLTVLNEGQSKDIEEILKEIENQTQILVKLIERHNKSDANSERRSDKLMESSERRQSSIITEINDVTDSLNYIKGRINGKGL
tara:strand:- start:4523 stop:4894 length:372 start_codon:yes stop_codon:yes gene_type:complete